MTKQTLIQYIQNHPACKDLKELNFGCEVKGAKSIPVVKYIGMSNEQYAFTGERKEESIIVFTDTIDMKNIIGHPPTLHHLLLIL